jgi:DNA-binding response OmpR family regulator
MCKVLVVEDNQDLADTLVYLLNRAGHDVRAVHDGLAAVGELKHWRPDAAVLDIGLPYLDCVQLAQHARDEHGASIRLIAYTASDTTQKRIAEAGFDAVLIKSAPIDEVLDKIRKPRTADGDRRIDSRAPAVTQ